VGWEWLLEMACWASIRRKKSLVYEMGCHSYTWVGGMGGMVGVGKESSVYGWWWDGSGGWSWLVGHLLEGVIGVWLVVGWEFLVVVRVGLLDWCVVGGMGVVVGCWSWLVGHLLGVIGVYGWWWDGSGC
jgi:hypothetical protein